MQCMWWPLPESQLVSCSAMTLIMPEQCPCLKHLCAATMPEQCPCPSLAWTMSAPQPCLDNVRASTLPGQCPCLNHAWTMSVPQPCLDNVRAPALPEQCPRLNFAWTMSLPQCLNDDHATMPIQLTHFNMPERHRDLDTRHSAGQWPQAKGPASQQKQRQGSPALAL